jgi:site-specific DNA recombinase
MRDAAWIAGQTPLKPSDHELVEKIIVDEETITIKLRRGLLLGGHVPSSASEAVSDSAVELTAAVAFTRRGAETKLVLPGLAQRSHSSKCDPALIKAIVRGRAWFEELATGRARSLHELAKRDGISRRYVRRLVGLRNVLTLRSQTYFICPGR